MEPLFPTTPPCFQISRTCVFNYLRTVHVALPHFRTSLRVVQSGKQGGGWFGTMAPTFTVFLAPIFSICPSPALDRPTDRPTDRSTEVRMRMRMRTRCEAGRTVERSLAHPPLVRSVSAIMSNFIPPPLYAMSTSALVLIRSHSYDVSPATSPTCAHRALVLQPVAAQPQPCCSMRSARPLSDAPAARSRRRRRGCPRRRVGRGHGRRRARGRR